MEASMFMSGSWYEGPSSDQTVNEPHGRPILCMDVSGDKVVTGSSDHGLREYTISAGRARPSMAASQSVMKQKRQLYNKKYGHTDWVTSCAYAPDGKVLSGAMDSKLCLWDKTAVRCDDITGHKSSISKVMVDSNSVGISASYDASLLVWDLGTKECLTGLFKGHKDAVTTFEWYNSLVISAARDGSLAFWDINTGKAFKKTSAHEGAVSKIKFFDDGSDNSIILTSGLNDGVVCAHDMRSNKLISCERVHSGAINVLDVYKGAGTVLTGSADKSLKLLDISSGYKAIETMKATDSIYCGEVASNLAFVGCLDGNMLVYNLDNGECLYGYGADNEGAVQVLKVLPEQNCVLAGGDAGKLLKMCFD